jgi:hypothetical protein
MVHHHRLLVISTSRYTRNQRNYIPMKHHGCGSVRYLYLTNKISPLYSLYSTILLVISSYIPTSSPIIYIQQKCLLFNHDIHIMFHSYTSRFLSFSIHISIISTIPQHILPRPRLPPRIRTKCSA